MMDCTVSDSRPGPSSVCSKPKLSAKEKVGNYFKMLSKGCGNEECQNEFCRSSPMFKYSTLNTNSAAVKAIEMVKKSFIVECSPIKLKITKNFITHIIEECKEIGSLDKLRKIIGESFSSADILMRSFRSNNTSGGEFHIEEVTDMMNELFSLPETEIMSTITNAVTMFSQSVKLDLQYHTLYERQPDILIAFLILFEIPVLDHPEFTGFAFPALLSAVTSLPLEAQKCLVLIWSRCSKAYLMRILTSLHQLITIGVISNTQERAVPLSSIDNITCSIKVMKLIYYASLLGGERDSDELIRLEQCATIRMKLKIGSQLSGRRVKDNEESRLDPLCKLLENLRSIHTRKPIIPHSEFINKSVNEFIDIQTDFINSRKPGNTFVFINHSFTLDISNKNQAMYFDNKIRMINERRSARMTSLFNYGVSELPFIKLTVQRNNLVDTTLNSLGLIMQSPEDLKKQLTVEFEGEQGIDEGGVSKEFFQLITEELFNANYGMFTYDESTRYFWFNPDSIECEPHYRMVGCLLGLAIYNHVILNIKFPPVIYRKLLGKFGRFSDMKTSHPVLHQSLTELLKYTGNIEEDIMAYFVMNRESVFGMETSHPLVEGGESKLVNQSNRQEFVDLFADFLLNKLIDRQFDAFYQGFHMVLDESPLEYLFSPEEVETLVCGSEDWDISALEETTDYDGGFTKEHEAIKFFWSVVHDMSLAQQKQLLAFTTGSDRVPVGGFAELKLIIARNGPDSDRLPTAHTCFNVLLLPEYSTRDKLKERLLLSITHAKGFGLL